MRGESQISVVEVEDIEEKEEEEQHQENDIVAKKMNVKESIQKQNIQQIETNQEYQNMETKHIPIVANTNRGLSLSDIRSLMASSSSSLTASSSYNLQHHTVNVNPVVVTNSTNIDGIPYPHNRQGIEALLDSTIQSARKIQKRAERYLSKSNSNLNHSILNIDLSDNKEEEEEENIMDYNHNLNNHNVNFVSSNSNNSSFRIYMKKAKRSKVKEDEVLNLRVLSDNVDDRLPLSIRRNNINNTTNNRIRRSKINNNNNRETISSSSNNMNYINNNHENKSIYENNFTRREMIHHENTFIKNEVSWKKSKEMFTPKQQHLRYNNNNNNNDDNENVENNNKPKLHLNLDLIETPSNKLQNVVGTLIADDNHMVDRISKARAKYFKERGKRIQMENSINKRGHFSPRSPYINRHNNLSSSFRNSNSKPVRSFR